MECDTTTATKQKFANFSSESIRLFYQDTTIADVTIVCNDNQLIKANKLILSSASKVLKNLITNNTGQSYIVMINVRSHNMELLIKYI